MSHDDEQFALDEYKKAKSYLCEDNDTLNDFEFDFDDDYMPPICSKCGGEHTDEECTEYLDDIYDDKEI